MKPLVSIITPSFNQERFIRETIESVLSQDYENVEYIVVDGGSTDGTLNILSEYEGKLKYISEKDNGQSDAINKGFKMANGEIVAWLNSDDVYQPGCIRKAVERFNNCEDVALVYGDANIIDESSNIIKLFENTQEFDYWKLINFWDYIVQPSTFFKTDKLKNAGYLDADLHYCMDWDLWIRLASLGRVEYVKEILACSREYSDTKTSTGSWTRLNEIKKMMRKYSRSKNPIGIQSYQSSTIYMTYGRGKTSKKVLGKYLTVKHKSLLRRLPERYSDGWIGKKYSYVIPNYISETRFVVDVPNEQLLPQMIETRVNGIVCGSVEIKNTMQQEIVVENKERNYTEVDLIPTKCKRLSVSDSRKLSFRVLAIKTV